MVLSKGLGHEDKCLQYQMCIYMYIDSVFNVGHPGYETKGVFYKDKD